MKNKLISKRKIKKCQEGEILDNLQMYTAGYADPVTVTASKKLNKRLQMQADEDWRLYLQEHPIEIGSEEYNRLPERAKAQVYKNSITNAIDRAALPTAVAIIAPTALTVGAASLVGSGTLTAAADAAGTIGTKIAGTNLGQAASAFINNPYIDMGLTALGAYTVPTLYNSGVSNIKQGNYGRALGDFASIGLEGLGFLGTINNIKNVYGPINRMMNGVYPKGIYTEPTTPKVTRISSSKMEATPKYVINDTPGYLLKILMRGNPLEKLLSKEGTISVNSIRALAQKGNNIEQEIINKILNSEEFVGLKAIDYNKFRKAVQDELIIYNRVPDERFANYGAERLGLTRPLLKNELSAPPQEITLDQPVVFGNPLDESILYNTFVFESPKIPFGNNKHYNDNTLGHSRTYTTTTEPDVLHVMESQSDWAQNFKHNSIVESNHDAPPNPLFGDIFSTTYIPELHKYLSNNYTQRQLQENMKFAAERGQTKMRYPTSETAAKIEGYKKQNKSQVLNLRRLIQKTQNDFENGTIEYQEYEKLVDDLNNQIRIALNSGEYSPEHQTILKKYSDFPKLFKKLYKNQEVRLVTDPQGNTWYEVDVPKDYLNLEWLYKCGGKVKKKLIKKRK